MARRMTSTSSTRGHRRTSHVWSRRSHTPAVFAGNPVRLAIPVGCRDAVARLRHRMPLPVARALDPGQARCWPSERHRGDRRARSDCRGAAPRHDGIARQASSAIDPVEERTLIIVGDDSTRFAATQTARFSGGAPVRGGAAVRQDLRLVCGLRALETCANQPVVPITASCGCAGC